jgi:serine/threonine-protein phosphatase PGAM5
MAPRSWWLTGRITGRLLSTAGKSLAAAAVAQRAACEDAPRAAPPLADEARRAVPEGATLLWSTADFAVTHDATGRRLLLDAAGAPMASAPPAGVEVAYRPECAWDANWDGRAQSRPSAKRVLVLVRHGQYETAPKERERHVLTALGHEQAAVVGDRLARLRAEAPMPFGRLVHSDMVRAVQTAAALTARLPGVLVDCEPDLAEGRPCVPQPSRSAQKWRRESIVADGARIERGFRKLVRRASEGAAHDEYIVVVCHANVIRYLVCRALQLPPEAWLRMSLPHCSLTTLCVYPSGRVSMHGFGDAGHLAPAQTTRS